MYAIRSYYAPENIDFPTSNLPSCPPSPEGLPRRPDRPVEVPAGMRQGDESRLELRRGEVDAPGQHTVEIPAVGGRIALFRRRVVDDGAFLRITSYNVCYTKLLRSYGIRSVNALCCEAHFTFLRSPLRAVQSAAAPS